MEQRIVGPEGAFLVTLAAARQDLEPLDEAEAARLVTRWMAEEPTRSLLRRAVVEALCVDGALTSDEELVRLFLLRLGSPWRLYREVAREPSSEPPPRFTMIGGAAEPAQADAEPAPAAAPEIRPCDFQTLVIKCQHMPDSDGKRTMTDARFWRDGGLDKDNLPAPTGGRARTKVIEVVGSHLDRGADEISVELRGGPGYGCARNHPKIRIVDSTREEQVFEGQTKVTFKAKCRELPPPPGALANPFALVTYHFFPDQVLNLYTIDVESCGVLADGSYGFGRTQQKVRVYPKDRYKLSISIPALSKRSYERGRAKGEDGTVTDSRSSSSSSRNPLTGETESTTRSESVSSKMIETSESYSFATRKGGLKETSKSSLDADNNLTSSRTLEHVDPVDHPATTVGATLKLEREGEDIKGAASLGELINAIVNIQNEVQSIMNFIRDFQPQVGWKFVFEMELFKGDLAFEWGYREWEDHTVYRYWKLDVGMTLFALSLELRFGAELKVCGVGVTALIFGNVSIDAKVSASKESSPADPSPWELAVKSKPKGELGIRSALGADWVKAEGKLGCEFEFGATCKCSTEEPFHIDWGLDFHGVKANVTGSVKFVGSIEREWTLIDPKKNWKRGRFPGGDPVQRPLRGSRGAIAAGA